MHLISEKSAKLLAGALITFFCCFFSSGCEKAGPKTYKVTGTVTYRGAPVPVGSISFFPEQPGPCGVAVIANGRYDTQRRGAIPGKQDVILEGYDGIERGENFPSGKMLFQWKTELEVEPRSNVFDIDVPDNAKPAA